MAQSARRKRRRDANQLAKLVVGIATGEVNDVPVSAGKNLAAVELCKPGGVNGCMARVVQLSANQGTEIANQVAKARYAKQ